MLTDYRVKIKENWLTMSNIGFLMRPLLLFPTRPTMIAENCQAEIIVMARWEGHVSVEPERAA